MTEDHGGDTTVQPRLWQQGHPPEAAPTRRRQHAHGRAQHDSGVGVAVAIQPTQRRGDHHQHRRARARAPAKLAGVDQAAWARSTGAKLDGDGGDWRWGVTKPHGQEDERDEAEQVRQRAAANLAGAHRSRARSSSATESPEGIRVRVRPRGE
jgi:hypothetical protein